MSELPKIGDKISVDKFFVSKMNVRAEVEFGDKEEDEALMTHLASRDIVQPFKARPEGEGYGVVIGRRRFLSKKKSGVKHFVVGKDCLITEMSDEEALDASVRENLRMFQAELDPVTRAKAVATVIAKKTTGLRGLARTWRVSPATLSEWLKVLELNEKMREVTAKRLLYYTDALTVAKMKLGNDLQNKLAETLETEGYEAFKKELARISAGKEKRGIPKGKYIILRTVFDRRYKPDLELHDKLSKLAEANDKKLDEYCKWVLSEHVKRA